MVQRETEISTKTPYKASDLSQSNTQCMEAEIKKS